MNFIKYLSIVFFVFFVNYMDLNVNEIDIEKDKYTALILPIKNEKLDEKNVLELDLDEDFILDTFIGTITGYGADCVGCTGEGYLACTTKEGKSYSLIYNDIYYRDNEYGNVRILAASHKKFPCGTIIDVTTSKESFRGIVLDTGATMRNAWNDNQHVWIDVAFKEEAIAEINMPLERNVEYNILRYGWN